MKRLNRPVFNLNYQACLVFLFLAFSLLPISLNYYFKNSLSSITSWFFLLFSILAFTLGFRKISYMWQKLPIILLLFFVFFLNLSKNINFQWNSNFDFSFFFPSGLTIACLFALVLSLNLFEQRIVARGISSFFIVLNLPAFILWSLLMIQFEIPYKLVNIGDYGFAYRMFFDFITLNDHTFRRIGQSVVSRFNGVYFEPGYLGTIAALLVIVNSVLGNRNRVHTCLLLGMGLASQSLSFLILTSVYYLQCAFWGQSTRKIYFNIFALFFTFLAAWTFLFYFNLNFLLFELLGARTGINISRDGSISSFLEYLSLSTLFESFFGWKRLSNMNTVFNIGQFYGLPTLFFSFAFLFMVNICALNGDQQNRRHHKFAMISLNLAFYQLIVSFLNPIFIFCIATVLVASHTKDARRPNSKH